MTRNVSSPAPEAGGGEPIAWPMDTAPRDGTFLRLRVRYEAGGDGPWTPLDDAEESWTVGFNNRDNTEEDRWQFVGWDWSHDYLLEAPGGEVIGWLPFHGEATLPPPDTSPEPVSRSPENEQGDGLEVVARVSCHHEAYQGSCAHCGVSIRDGYPVNWPPMVRQSDHLTALEAANRRIAELEGEIEARDNPPSGWVIIESDGRFLTIRDNETDRELTIDADTLADEAAQAFLQQGEKP